MVIGWFVVNDAQDLIGRQTTDGVTAVDIRELLSEQYAVVAKDVNACSGDAGLPGIPFPVAVQIEVDLSLNGSGFRCALSGQMCRNKRGK